MIAVRVYEAISNKGGQTAREIAVSLGYSLQVVNEALLALEGDGLLLYEDDSGGLYRFENK